MKKVVSLLVVICVLLSFAACSRDSAAPGAQQVTHLSYGAGTVGSTINAVVMAQTHIINENLPHVRITAEASGGGVDNMMLTHDNEFQISTAANISAWQGVNGVGVFDGQPTTHVLGWMPIYPSFFFLIVPRNSPIQTLGDIRGRRVSVGVRGSGAEQIVIHLLQGAGISYDEFRPFFLAQQESNDGLRDGSLDAIIYATGNPVPAIMELNVIMDIRLVPIPHAEAAVIADQFPFFSPGVIPGGSYDGMPDDIPTISGFTISFVRDSVPEQIVYDITKVLWENREEMGRMHASMLDLHPDMVRNGLASMMEVHPGAARYYREQGWM